MQVLICFLPAAIILLLLVLHVKLRPNHTDLVEEELKADVIPAGDEHEPFIL